MASILSTRVIHKPSVKTLTFTDLKKKRSPFFKKGKPTKKYYSKIIYKLIDEIWIVLVTVINKLQFLKCEKEHSHWFNSTHEFIKKVFSHLVSESVKNKIKFTLVDKNDVKKFGHEVYRKKEVGHEILLNFNRALTCMEYLEKYVFKAKRIPKRYTLIFEQAINKEDLKSLYNRLLAAYKFYVAVLDKKKYGNLCTAKKPVAPKAPNTPNNNTIESTVKKVKKQKEE